MKLNFMLKVAEDHLSVEFPSNKSGFFLSLTVSTHESLRTESVQLYSKKECQGGVVGSKNMSHS